MHTRIGVRWRNRVRALNCALVRQHRREGDTGAAGSYRRIAGDRIGEREHRCGITTGVCNRDRATDDRVEILRSIRRRGDRPGRISRLANELRDRRRADRLADLPQLAALEARYRSLGHAYPRALDSAELFEGGARDEAAGFAGILNAAALGVAHLRVENEIHTARRRRGSVVAAISGCADPYCTSSDLKELFRDEDTIVVPAPTA